ncbi:nucleoside hydrolase [Streptococcus dysgalactiae]|uniref:Inosine-uridine preferring nucleoside hydrolase n=1 Tax=Streptococcus dysgalactiae subsp. equisimilis TaxID=119602 RepID=A0A9X8SXV4_STREQ|nr:nucleoside hydrolase [Streptococcus dysgalactiae]SQF66140.1 inosine-uridine preferring nucleoside hydrolase [Streptococcus dysgalactiae subsp. equisimilis]VEF04563.1 inosine-uridine preferring nucleoside hydrolase [Streptococcus dysgalactiae subsp. equisimilis]
MTKQPIIIDCDPGIDDSLALLYALKHPKLEVIAITLVQGNVPVSIGLQNTILLLERVNRLDIPIYLGRGIPLERDYVSAQDTHGIDGLGDSLLQPSVIKEAEVLPAADFLAQHFAEPSETAIIALGPLTNVAEALGQNPNMGKHCHRFVSMGGAFKAHGNCSPVAEYNYWCDPHAARLTFKQLGRKLEMVGLDVTRQIVLTPNHLSYMARLNPEETVFIENITHFYFDFHWECEHLIGCVINDPLAVVYFLTPTICQGFDSYTDVATEGIALGQTVVDQYDFYHKKANSHILTTVNSKAFWSEFIATILEVPLHQVVQDLDHLQLG